MSRLLLVPVLLLPLVAGCSRGSDEAAGFSGADAADVRERETGFRGIVLPEPIAKADFTLTDTDGEPFDFRARTDGYLTLLFFGYTSCPDVCPVHMANLAAVLDRLDPVQRNRIRVVFVTTDPERDTPDVLRAWLDHFDPDFIGLRGTRADVNRIEASFNLAQSIVPDTVSGDDYVVGHAAQLLAFSPEGPAHVVYPFGTRQIDWVHDLPKLLHYDWAKAAAAQEPAT